METKGKALSARSLTCLCALAYMVSYITRKNFGAIISEIELQTEISKTLLSLSLTGSFITYGIGQVISGIFGDRFSPKRLVSLGLALAALTNIVMVFMSDPYAMLAVWCINGFAQSLMWPPIVKLMTGILTTEVYKKKVVTVSCASCIGTVIVFISSPLIISLLGWRWVFAAAALAGVLMCILWCTLAPDIEIKVQKDPAADKKEAGGSRIFTLGFVFLLLATAAVGMLREGVETWMPTYIFENFDLGNIAAILSGVLLPIFAIVCYNIASRIYEKKFSSPMLFSGVIFSLGALAALSLFLLSGRSAAAAMILMALISGCMHGASLMLTAMAPPIFADGGRMSTVSGIVNSCTYVGSALSTYLVASFTESRGWDFTVFIWFVMAMLGVAFSFGSSIFNKQKRG